LQGLVDASKPNINDLTGETFLVVSTSCRNYEIVPAEKSRYPIKIAVRREGSDEPFDSSLTYPSGTVTRVQAKLSVPAELDSPNAPAVQYVMETSKGAKFTTPVMCDGRRSHATQADGIVVLEIDGTEPHIELLGAWATGHEPVTLTPTAVLLRQEDEL
jgi:hypothetical protein